jgi:hypothetical protein
LRALRATNTAEVVPRYKADDFGVQHDWCEGRRSLEALAEIVELAAEGGEIALERGQAFGERGLRGGSGLRLFPALFGLASQQTAPSGARAIRRSELRRNYEAEVREMLERGFDRRQVVELVEAVRAAAQFAHGLRAAQEEQAQDARPRGGRG